MTRTECEALIAQKLWDIEQIYAQYNPEGKYLSLAIIKTEEYDSVMMNNSYFDDGRDEEHPKSVDADFPINRRFVDWHDTNSEEEDDDGTR